MKAGKSSDTAIVLPRLSTKVLASVKVSSSVAMPRIISTSCMTGTGFMKWMPTKRSGRSVAAASRVIEIDEVFEATTAVGLRCWHSSWKILRLTCSSSVATSMTRSQSPSSLNDGAKAMRPIAFVFGFVCDQAARDLPRHIAVDGRHGLVVTLLGQVVDADVVSRQRHDMGDTVAHRASADDADPLEVGRQRLGAGSRPGERLAGLECDIHLVILATGPTSKPSDPSLATVIAAQPLAFFSSASNSGRV